MLLDLCSNTLLRRYYFEKIEKSSRKRVLFIVNVILVIHSELFIIDIHFSVLLARSLSEMFARCFYSVVSVSLSHYHMIEGYMEKVARLL